MQHAALVIHPVAQVWANKLAAADNADGTCAVIQEVFRAEDIPYGVTCLYSLGTATSFCLFLTCSVPAGGQKAGHSEMAPSKTAHSAVAEQARGQ